MIPYLCRGGQTRYVLKSHLPDFHRAQMAQYRGPTGRQIVESAGLKCVIGERNRYYWRTRTVMLQERVANGTDPASVVIAKHEIAHSTQPPIWMRFLWIVPFRWFVECECWERVFGTGV